MNAADFLESRTGRVLLVLGRAAFWAGAAVLAFALCRRGIILSDEGDLLSSAAAMLEGKVLYRDLDLFVTPGAWLLNAAIFSITGPSIIATRIAGAVCLLMTMAATRRIVRTVGGPLWGDFGAALIAIFAVWAWPAWTWCFYSPWATLFSLIALACTLDWMRSRRAGWLVACGIALGLAIAFKQNYGVFAAVGCVVAILFDEFALAPRSALTARNLAGRTFRAGMFIALGGALVLVPGVLWLAWKGALPDAFELLMFRPFQGFIDSHTIRYVRFGDLWRRLQIWAVGGLVYMAVPMKATGVTIRWSPSGVTLLVLLHIALYWIPIFTFAGFGVRGLLRLRRERAFSERALLATVLFAAIYFLGVFPRADFNHLINVYQPVLAALAAGGAVLFGRGRWRASWIRTVPAAAAALVVFCYACVSAVWMNDLRKTVWLPLEAPRASMILVDPLDAQMLNDEIRLLRTLTVPDEPVFALPNLSMIPFLAERPMPTRYRNFYSVHIGFDAGLAAARAIEESEARVIVASYDNFFSDPIGMLTYAPELSDYVRRHFKPAFSIGTQTHMVLLRRKKPLDPVPALGLWFLCDVRGGGFPAVFQREHLLFRSLYHSFRGAWAEHNQGLTSCQLQVPRDGQLKLALELRQPMGAQEEASARAEILLFRGRRRPQRVLTHEWPLATEITSVRSAPREYDVDLSRWGGQVVNVLLRSVVEGKIRDAPFDPFGLTVMWNDARIESPEYAEEAAADTVRDELTVTPDVTPTTQVPAVTVAPPAAQP